MKKNIALITIVFILGAAAVYILQSRTDRAGRDEVDRGTAIVYQRIVSMTPGTTEILYALGLGDRVIGVSSFCRYPPEVRNKVNVGGYLDPNYEAIAALESDLVILLPEQDNVRRYLAELGIASLTVDNKTVDQICSSIRTIGYACGVGQRADEIVGDIRSRMQNIRERSVSSHGPRVLISVERTTGSGSLRDVYAAGKNTFYDELIIAAGGVNTLEDSSIPYPVLSAEGLLALNPDIIIDMIPGLEESGLDRTALIREWGSVGSVNAVKKNHVYILSDDYIFIPGPRFILFLENLARIIHADDSPK